MIAAWHFCASLRVDDQQASIWLAVLDELEVGDNDDRVAIACERLDHADTWQQAYALPLALRRAHGRDPSTRAAIALRRFALSLVELLPDGLAPAFRRLFAALFDDGVLAAAIDTARTAALLLEALPRREPSQRPYIDLPRFLSEAILLAVLGELARREVDLGALDDSDPVAALTDRALGYAFGRLPFLLAIDLELARGRVSPEQLEQRIWTAPLCNPAMEPDLLAADARVMLVQRGPSSEVGALIDESLLLGRLLTHLAAHGHHRSPSARPDLVPLAHTHRAEALLPVVFWQLALWELAVRRDPAAAIQRLSGLWSWEPATSLQVVNLRGPVGNTAGAWRRCAEAMLSLRGLSLSVRVEDRSQLDLPPVAAWLVFSPWVRFDPEQPVSRRSTPHRYPRPLDVVAVVRLFGSAALAVRLLRTLPADVPAEDRRRAMVAALVVHAADVLAMYDAWLNKGEESDVSRRLGEAETILAQFAERQCKHAGHGHHACIAPESFTQLFGLAADARSLAPDARRFVDEIVPRVLMGFIYDGYTTILDDAGTARWLPKLVAVYDRYRTPRQAFLDHRTRVRSALVVRFLAPDPGDRQRRPEPSDRLNRDGVRNARTLLLWPRRTAADWQEMDRRAPTKQGGGSPISIIERFAALAGLPVPEAMPDTRQELGNALDSIARREDLDRFVRLRLLELLEEPALRDDAANQQRIALLVLEYGSPYDQQQLLRCMFPTDHAWDADTPDARRQVRSAVLCALAATLARPTDDRDPIDLENHERHHRAMREAVRRLALCVNPPRVPGDSELLAVLRQQAERDAARHNERLSLVAADIEIHDDCAYLVHDSELDLEAVELDLAVRHPDQPRAVLAVDHSALDASSEPSVPDGDEQTHDVVAPIKGALRPMKVAALDMLAGPRRRAAVTIAVRGEQDPVVAGEWDADLSRRFAAEGHSEVPGLARFDGKHWIPEDRDFDQLLATEWTQCEPRLLVLCYLGRGTARGTGHAGHRFQARPGENYLLEAEHFDDEALRKLDERLGHAGARGLLVTVSPVLDHGRVRLALAGGASVLTDERARARYPSLCQPFDDRNLAWRRFLAAAGNEPALAERGKQGRWTIAVDPSIPGYPDAIQVTWDKPPKTTDDSAMAQVLQWGATEQGCAEVKARAVPVRSVHYGESAARFYRVWMDLHVGQRLRVAELGWLNSEGQFDARTENGVPVLVDGETITMRFIEGSWSLDGVPRACEVTRVGSWKRVADPIAIAADDLPPEVVRAGGGRGILVQVPHVRSRRRLCKILWNIGRDCLEREIMLERLQAQPELGMVAEARRYGSAGWELAVENRLVTTSALWTLTQEDHVPAGALFLGRARLGDRALWLAELHPGELLELATADPSWRHLAAGDGGGCYGGLDPRAVTRNDGGRFTWRLPEGPTCRSHLSFPEGVLPGSCNADQRNDVVAQSVGLTLLPAGTEDGARSGRVGLLLLQRRFELVRHVHAPRPRAPEVRTPQQILDDYFAAEPIALDAELRTAVREDGHTIAQVEIRPQSSIRYLFPTRDKGWVPRVDLEAGEEPWFAGAHYAPGNCRVILKRTEAGYAASFRGVPDMTVAQFREHVARGVPLGELVKLSSNRVYYIGGDRAQDGSWGHRFEWGHGYTLVASEQELRFRGERFANAALVLFYGDWIRAVTFLPTPDVPAATIHRATTEDDEPDRAVMEHCVMSIEHAHIEVSQARELYDQRTRHRIVHLLWVRRRTLPSGGTEPEVDHVLGFDPDAAVDSERAFHPSSRVEVEGSVGFEDIEDEAYILARLDVQAFESSGGRRVVFRRVDFAFDGAADVLESGELVFLRAGSIRTKRNDVGLELQPINGFLGTIAPVLRDLLLMRRQFSCRQNLLRRIHDAQLTQQELTDKLLLVKLDRGGKRINADLVNRMPSRRPAVLRQGAARDHMMLCTVAGRGPDQVDPKWLRLELRPGVFVEIPLTRTDQLDPITDGDIVRVEVRGDRYRVTLAASGDESLVPEGGRPTVALPKNQLLRDQFLDNAYRSHGFWHQRHRDFSAGGLPDVELSAGWFDPHEQRWRPLRADQAIRLMATPHPRLGTLVRDPDDEHQFWLWPRLDERTLGGRLKYDADEHRLWLAPIAAPLDDRVPRNALLPWMQASFADESITEIRTRIDQHRWRYHDTECGHWEGGSQAGGTATKHTVKPHTVEPTTGWDGPIFAELHGDIARLRYAPERFIRFGFPVAELLAAFGRRDRLEVTVAGVSRRGGLWLELAPGRIVELPAQLVMRRVADEERSIARFHWAAFTSGDRIVVALSSRDPLNIDRLSLEDWHPGARGGFGAAIAILPVAGYDPQAGVASLGAGACALRIPFAEPPPRRIALYPDNSWSEASGLPEPGDTVLLVLDPERRPAIAGYPELRPRPDRETDGGFEGDPLGALLLHSEAMTVQTIEAAGGAIPVTVGAIAARHVLYFHRQRQIPACQLPPGALGRGQVLGAAGQSVLLRWGGGILISSVEDIVAGLPESLHAAALTELRVRQTAIWLVRAGDGRLLCRADVPDPAHEIVAAAEIVLEAGSEVGVVCRDTASGALLWLPSREAAWAELSRDELAFLFPRSLPFAARVGRSARLSVVRLQTVQREFRQLEIGAELGVRVERARERAAGYLVSTSSSRVMLSCIGRLEDAPIGREIKVEVVERIESPPRLAVTPSGHKRPRLDLPSIILAEIASPGVAKAAFDAGGLTFHAGGEAPSVPRGPMSDSIGVGETLERRLAVVYQRAGSASGDADGLLRECSTAATRWVSERARDKELSLAHALMAILLLDRVGAGGVDRTERAGPGHRDSIEALRRAFDMPWDRAVAHQDEHVRLAVELAVNVGRRARRSRHIELLAQAWLFYEEAGTRIKRRDRNDDLWLRLRQVTRDLRERLDEDAMTAEYLDRLRSMCFSIELRGGASDQPQTDGVEQPQQIWKAGLPAVATALRASLGEARNIELLRNGAPMLGELAAMPRVLQPTNGEPRPYLPRGQLQKLRDMVDVIQMRGWNLWLLEPLPARVSRRGPV